MKFIGYILIIFCALFVFDIISSKFLGVHLLSLNPFIDNALIGPKKLLCNFQGKDYFRQPSALGSDYEYCVVRVSDGGNSCISGSACQSGKCYVGKDVPPSSSYVGKCGDTREINNCQFAEIEDGKIVLDIRGAICD